MTKIRLHNTKTRKKEFFTPLDPKNVRMYVCGPTVYDRAHMGNARAAVVFDVLYRLLRQVYGADHVTYARNITDVDDKINARAAETRTDGETELEAIARITKQTTQWYLDDMAALGVLEPDEMPRATAFVPQMIAMIEGLIANEHAYAKDGHVLFRVRSYADYGAFSGRSVDDMIAGARVEVAPYKEDPMDFVLWKPSPDDLPGWESPWGRGRPGWHIECSAMADDILWQKPLQGGRLSDAALEHPHTIDIHGGGNDLLFPHHENEIAQSRCAHGGADFARVWMHNEMLQVEGKKMSKSLGNFFTVRDLLSGHDGLPSVPGEVIRFVMLSTHYRKPMDWTAEKSAAAQVRLFDFVALIARGADLDRAWQLEPDPEIVDALADDMNTHAALERVFQIYETPSPDHLARNIEFLGILSFDQLRERVEKYNRAMRSLETIADRLQAMRVEAQESKNFDRVDALKQELMVANVSVMMNKDGVSLLPGYDFDPAKLEALK